MFPRTLCTSVLFFKNKMALEQSGKFWAICLLKCMQIDTNCDQYLILVCVCSTDHMPNPSTSRKHLERSYVGCTRATTWCFRTDELAMSAWGCNRRIPEARLACQVAESTLYAYTIDIYAWHTCQVTSRSASSSFEHHVVHLHNLHIRKSVLLCCEMSFGSLVVR